MGPWCGQAVFAGDWQDGEYCHQPAARARSRPPCLSSSSSKSRPSPRRNPNTGGNQNVHLLFAVAGELLSRGKNKLSLALSAASWGSLLPSSEGGLAALFSFPAATLRL